MNTYMVQLKGGQTTVKAEGPQEAVTEVVKKYWNCEVNITPVQKGNPNANVLTKLLQVDGHKAKKESEQWYFIAQKTGNANKVNPILQIMKSAGKKKAAFAVDYREEYENGHMKLYIAGVPSFLAQNIRLAGEYQGSNEQRDSIYAVTLQLKALEGVETIQYYIEGGIVDEVPAVPNFNGHDIVIAYEEITPEEAKGKLSQAPDGKYYNVWWKKNAADTLVKQNGEFFEKPKPVQAQLCTKDFPTFLGNVQNRLKRVNNGWQYNVSWQKEPLFAEDNKGYWVKYGEGDFNYLNIRTDSAAAYTVLDANGNPKINLVAYYKQHHH